MKSKILFTISCVLFLVSGLYAQIDISKNLKISDEPLTLIFDHATMLNYISQNADSDARFELSIPTPQGPLNVMVQRNQVLSPEFILTNPDLYTLDVFNKDKGKFIGCVTISPYGFYFLNLSDRKPYTLNSQHYSEPSKLLYTTNDQIIKRKDFMPSCGQKGKIDTRKNISLTDGMRFTNDFQWGDKINRYRAVVVCTGEFYLANGNADGPVNTVITNSINSISAIFRNELSVIFQLNGTRLYNDPNMDPFTPDDLAGADPRTTQASQAVNAVFASSTYDVGHVFHTHKNGDNWSTGGVAYLQSVCDNKAINSQNVPMIKAGGWSGSFSNIDYGWYQLAAHEYAHMFGAEHTFNGLGNSCTEAIGENSAVEIGSGTTIMSYSGLCNDDQNIANGESDGYFHTFSLQQMSTYILGEGGTCSNNSNSGNALPVADANPCGSNLEIPKGTPFYLNGSAIDADPNTALTYTWEQMDEDGAGVTPTQGIVGSGAAFFTNSPLFRCFSPTANSDRYFPALNNSNPSFEVLPQVARDIKMAFTVRDNRSSGGAVGTDFITIKVNPTGPFTVTKPSSGETVSAGTMTTFTWNTNGSQGLCSNLRIKLSIDGGKTYPTVLAENVPYPSGTFTFMMPANAFKSSTAKIIMECMDRECAKFFAVSSNVFTIQSACENYGSVVCPDTKVTADQGAANLNMNTTKYVGNNAIGARRTVTDSSPRGVVAISGAGGVPCASASNDYYHERFNIYVTKTGTYTFTVAPYIPGVQRAFFSIFRSNYSPSNPCASFVASSAIDAGGGSLIPFETFNASLTACTEYVVVMHSFQLPVNASIANIVGPGLVIEKITPPVAFSNHFIIVNQGNNTIAGISQTTDLTTYPGGMYRIYSMNAENLTPADITALIGTSFSAFVQSKCLTISSNFRDVEIRSSCTISDIAISSQGACDPASNTHTQDLIITYDKAPTTGKLRVNGQDFDITTSPQTIKLTNIDSDGIAKNVTALFTDLPSCTFTKNNVFSSPPNCCPAIVELGNDISKCVGESIVLDGGNTGSNYKWFKDGNEIMGQITSSLTVTSSGLYRVEVTHSTGCKKNDAVTVTFNALPTVVLQSQLSFCESTTLTLQPTISGGVSQQWFRGNTIISGSTSTTLDVTQAGSYTVVVTSAHGCTSSATTLTSIVPKPVVDLGAPIQKCESEAVTLNAGAGAQGYEWYRDGILITNATMATYRPTQSGIYRVVVTSGANCSAEDQVNVMFFASPSIIGLASEYKPCQNTNFTLQTMIAGHQSITWFYNNSPIGSSNVETIPVSNSGIYIVEAVNNIGCKTRDTTTVAFKPLPVIPFGTDVTACDGNSVELNGGTDGTIYKWAKNGLNLSNTTPKIMVTESGTYAVTVTNADGCTSTAQKMISFIPGPTLDLGGDKAICQDESYTITASTNAINPTIRWFKNGVIITGETTLSLSVNEAGNYEAKIVGGTPPCEVAKSVIITINPKPGINLGQDKMLCEGEPFPTLDAGANHTSINWTFNGAAAGTTRTISADKSGLYRASVMNNFNCQNTDEIRVTINPLPTLTIPSTFDLCQGDTLNITAASNATTFQWKNGANVINGQTASAIKLSTAGTFTVVASTAANCKREAMFTITSRPSPSVNLGPDVVLCPEKSITLNAGTHTSYFWSDNTTASTVVINAGEPASTTTKSISVIVKNQFLCDDTDTVLVKINQVVKTIISSDKTGVCNGAPVMLTSNGGGNKWLWSGPDGTLSDLDMVTTTVSPTVTSIYTVIASDTECPGNQDTATINIQVFEAMNISAGEDDAVIKGRTIKLNASGGVSYQWNKTNLIEGASNIFNPVVKPTEPTTFTVTITDKNGCEFADSVFINVIDDPLSLFKAVTFISPNDDGVNDVLEFEGLEAFPENHLKIYNRWGNVVYEKVGYQDDDERFDGTRNGERLPADTYYYILEFADRLVKSALTIMWPN